MSTTVGQHEGKVAVVTGASRGIGLAIAQRLVAEGTRVVITGRHEDTLAEAVERLGGAGSAVGVAGHTDDERHQRETLAAARERFGRLDYLVNNAGINPHYGPMLDSDVATGRRILDVNVLAAFAWTQQAVRGGLGTQDAPGGVVVNIASVAGLGATGVLGWYAVSKAALIHLTKELGQQLAPQVRVNAVAPAVVKTTFARALYEGREERVIRGYPMQRLGRPGDVSGAVSFLLSEDAAWMTGETMVIDGGLTLSSGV